MPFSSTRNVLQKVEKMPQKVLQHFLKPTTANFVIDCGTFINTAKKIQQFLFAAKFHAALNEVPLLYFDAKKKKMILK